MAPAHKNMAAGNPEARELARDTTAIYMVFMQFWLPCAIPHAQPNACA